MAYTTINKSTDHFNTLTWTGDGGTKSFTGVGFAPDLVWSKARVALSGITGAHFLFDSVRGGGAEKEIRSTSTGAEGDSANQVYGYVSSFDSDGFTTTAGSSNNNYFNESSKTYVSWNWKAGTTGSGTSTGSGTGKAYSYSVNTTAGFSIVKYTGNGSSGHTIPHHLGAIPQFIILKPLDAADNWRVYHQGLDADAADFHLQLQSTGARNDHAGIFNDTKPTSSVFTLGNDDGVNKNDDTFIAYCFAEKTGYSKAGYYAGATTPNFIYTGFKPKFIIAKSSSGTNASSQDWYIIDAVRDPSNPTTKRLAPNSTSAENDNSNNSLNFLSNGFSFNTNNDQTNRNDGQSYVYLAIGQSLVGSNNVPALAR